MPADPTDPTPGGRRAPRQARGAARVDAILDAAEQVIAEAGPDGASLNAIAAAARTAPGSLYHFFADKDAVLAALAERQAEAFSRVMASAVPADAARWPLRRALAHVLDEVAGFYDAHPTFEPVRRALRRRAGHAAGQHARDDADVDAITAALLPVVAARLPLRPPAEQRVVTQVVVAMADGVLTASAELAPAARAVRVAELLDALDAYVAAVGRRS